MHCYPHDFRWSTRAGPGVECTKCGKFVNDLNLYEYLNERYDRYQYPTVGRVVARPPCKTEEESKDA